MRAFGSFLDIVCLDVHIKDVQVYMTTDHSVLLKLRFCSILKSNTDHEFDVESLSVQHVECIICYHVERKVLSNVIFKMCGFNCTKIESKEPFMLSALAIPKQAKCFGATKIVLESGEFVHDRESL